MSEFFDANGEPIEGFSQEEVDAKLEEGTKELESAKKEEAEELNKTITDMQEEMSKMGDKDYNFKKVEKFAKEKEAEAIELQKKLDDNFGGVNSMIDTRLNEEKLNSKIESLSGGDKEVSDKIRFHFNSFSSEKIDDPAKREEAFIAKLSNAYLLATGSKPSSPLTGQVIGSNMGSSPNAGKPSGLSKDAKDIAGKFELSDEEIKDAEKKGLI